MDVGNAESGVEAGGHKRPVTLKGRQYKWLNETKAVSVVNTVVGSDRRLRAPGNTPERAEILSSPLQHRPSLNSVLSC